LRGLVDFNRGKSCLLRLSTQALETIFTKVPLYGMLVDVPSNTDPGDRPYAPREGTTQARLLGTTAIDLACFRDSLSTPPSDAEAGFRRGTFYFFDLLGVRCGALMFKESLNEVLITLVVGHMELLMRFSLVHACSTYNLSKLAVSWLLSRVR
jgi:hypothetical protein